jgi:hypothetical protein
LSHPRFCLCRSLLHVLVFFSCVCTVRVSVPSGSCLSCLLMLRWFCRNVMWALLGARSGYLRFFPLSHGPRFNQHVTIRFLQPGIVRYSTVSQVNLADLT